VTKGGTIDPAYGQSGLVTGGSGTTGYAFQVSESEAEGVQLRIEATASKSGETDTTAITVTVSKTSVPGFQVTLELDRSDYLSGEKLSAKVRGSVEGDPSKYNYVYTVFRSAPGPGPCDGNIITILASKLNSFDFALPQDLEGTFRLCATVSDGAGNESTDDAPFTVTYARLLVNADRLSYEKAGEAITFSFALVAKDSAAAKYFFEVRDSAGALRDSGVPQGGGFAFVIPQNPARSYTALVSASFGGHLVTGSVTLTQAVGIKMRVWVITPSSLASGAFQPGESIKLGFEFYSVGGAPMPTVFRVDYATLGRDDARSHLGSSPGGELAYTVPADAGDGTVIVNLAGSTGGAGLLQDAVVLNVDRDANPMDLRLAGGISLFHLVVFILLLSLLAFLILRNRESMREALRRKEAPGGGGGGGLFGRRKRGVQPAAGPVPAQPQFAGDPQQGYPQAYQQGYQQAPMQATQQQQWQPQQQHQSGPAYDQAHAVPGQVQGRRGQPDSYIPPPGPD
jgi:hypothetical protein